jgi:hypothetical protein
MKLLILLLESFLRLFGLFWIFGGILTLQKTRESLFLDYALAKISSEKVDRFDSYFLFICGTFTLLCGIFLLILNRWTIIFLLLLILSQLLYFQIKRRRFLNAITEEEKSAAIVNQTTKNAFVTSLVITLITVIYILIK